MFLCLQSHCICIYVRMMHYFSLYVSHTKNLQYSHNSACLGFFCAFLIYY